MEGFQFLVASVRSKGMVWVNGKRRRHRCYPLMLPSYNTPILPVSLSMISIFQMCHIKSLCHIDGSTSILCNFYYPFSIFASRRRRILKLNLTMISTPIYQEQYPEPQNAACQSEGTNDYHFPAMQSSRVARSACFGWAQVYHVSIWWYVNTTPVSS